MVYYDTNMLWFGCYYFVSNYSTRVIIFYYRGYHIQSYSLHVIFIICLRIYLLSVQSIKCIGDGVRIFFIRIPWKQFYQPGMLLLSVSAFHRQNFVGLSVPTEQSFNKSAYRTCEQLVPNGNCSHGLIHSLFKFWDICVSRFSWGVKIV